jgi:ankyrin repeat protein
MVDTCNCNSPRYASNLHSILNDDTSFQWTTAFARRYMVLNSAIHGAGSLEIVRLLTLDYGSPPLVRCRCTHMAGLHAAALKGRTEITAFFVRSGLVDANAADQLGNRPLHWEACGYDNSDVVKSLIEVGAEVDTPNHAGYTPFMKACLSGSFRTAHALLDAGAHGTALFPPYRNTRGKIATPLHCLCRNMIDFFRPASGAAGDDEAPPSPSPPSPSHPPNSNTTATPSSPSSSPTPTPKTPQQQPQPQPS